MRLSVTCVVLYALGDVVYCLTNTSVVAVSNDLPRVPTPAQGNATTVHVPALASAPARPAGVAYRRADDEPPKKKKKGGRSTSSDSKDKKDEDKDEDDDSLQLSDEEEDENDLNKKDTNKYMPKSSLERKGWKKWHRKCTPCPDEQRVKWRDPGIKWICGAYQDARRSFKSPCSMRLRNCQDGTMFVKISDHRCKDDPYHGNHFFYDYKVKITDESTQSGDQSSSEREQSTEYYGSEDARRVLRPRRRQLSPGIRSRNATKVRQHKKNTALNITGPTTVHAARTNSTKLPLNIH